MDRDPIVPAAAARLRLPTLFCVLRWNTLLVLAVPSAVGLVLAFR